jgi:hypothetical protein
MTSSTSLPGAASWGGGWSNRAASVQNPTLGFGFGGNAVRPSGDSQQADGLANVTPDDSADADVESTEDEDVEVIPLGTEAGMDEVEVISIEAPGDQQTGDQQVA